MTLSPHMHVCYKGKGNVDWECFLSVDTCWGKCGRDDVTSARQEPSDKTELRPEESPWSYLQMGRQPTYTGVEAMRCGQ